MFSSELPNEMLSNAVQEANAFISMTFIIAGIAILLSEEHPRNASLSIEVAKSGISTMLNDMSPEKRHSSILPRVYGR